VTKHYFIILALIILSKKSVTSGNLDVYLQLFIEELQVLWKGVQAFDVTKGEIQLTSHLNLDCASLSNLWIVCKLCDKKAHKMPTLWLNHKISLFKKIEKNVILWESSLLASKPPFKHNKLHSIGKQKSKFHLCGYLHQILSNGSWNKKSGYKVQGIELAGDLTPYTKMASSN
jgi:hypothetical protein